MTKLQDVKSKTTVPDHGVFTTNGLNLIVAVDATGLVSITDEIGVWKASFYSNQLQE